MAKAGLSANDIERIVFVGGPTNYSPLREAVCAELALKADLSINPMTAVAEGASIFAESINWEDERHGRKATNAEIKSDIDVSLRYNARSPESSARVVFLTSVVQGYSAEIRSLDTGWTSGRTELYNGISLTLPLSTMGDNHFEVSVFDDYGRTVPLPDSRIVITRVIANIGAIPASQSIGVEVMSSLGGSVGLQFLVREGDDLPKKGITTFKAGQTIRAGSNESLNIKLWEGNIESPVDDNRFIGVIKISGTDFDYGIINTGAEIVCEYEMGDSGAIQLELSIPSISASFGNKNFYSRKEGQQDVLDVDKISESGQDLLYRIDQMGQNVDDERLDQAREKAKNAAELGSSFCSDEDKQQASNDLLEIKKLLFEVRKDNLSQIRQGELDDCIASFDAQARKYARPTEAEAFDRQAQAAQRAIDRNEADFESLLEQLNGKIFPILYRQDWFAIDLFKSLVRSPYDYFNPIQFAALKQRGEKDIANDTIDDLRTVIYELVNIRMRDTSFADMVEQANIIKG